MQASYSVEKMRNNSNKVEKQKATQKQSESNREKRLRREARALKRDMWL